MNAKRLKRLSCTRASCQTGSEATRSQGVRAGCHDRGKQYGRFLGFWTV